MYQRGSNLIILNLKVKHMQKNDITENISISNRKEITFSI